MHGPTGIFWASLTVFSLQRILNLFLNPDMLRVNQQYNKGFAGEIGPGRHCHSTLPLTAVEFAWDLALNLHGI